MSSQLPTQWARTLPSTKAKLTCARQKDTCVHQRQRTQRHYHQCAATSSIMASDRQPPSRGLQRRQRHQRSPAIARHTHITERGGSPPVANIFFHEEIPLKNKPSNTIWVYCYFGNSKEEDQSQGCRRLDKALTLLEIQTHPLHQEEYSRSYYNSHRQ